MAIIYSYPQVTNPLSTDVLVLTDTMLSKSGKRKNATKSLALSDLASYVISSTSTITGSGTLNTIPMFTPSGVKIGDSIITQSLTPIGISVNGRLSVTGDLIVGSRSTFSGYARFNGTIQDYNNLSGTAGQILSSTGTNVQWVDADTEALIKTVVITDSQIKTLGTAPITILPNVADKAYQIIAASFKNTNIGTTNLYDWTGIETVLGSSSQTTNPLSHRVEVPTTSQPSGGPFGISAPYMASPIAGTWRVNTSMIFTTDTGGNPSFSSLNPPQATITITLTYRLV